MRAIHFIGALGVLAFTVSVLAAPQPLNKKVQVQRDAVDPAGQMIPGPVNDTMSPANNCDDPLAAGTLTTVGGSLVGNTLGAGDDFQYCSEEGPPDEIWAFEVEATGRWRFTTCNTDTEWDTVLVIMKEIGTGCPGILEECQDDAACDTYTCGGAICTDSGICLGNCTVSGNWCFHDGHCSYGVCTDPPGQDCELWHGTCAGDGSDCDWDYQDCEDETECIPDCTTGPDCVLAETCDADDLLGPCSYDSDCSLDYCYGTLQCEPGVTDCEVEVGPGSVCEPANARCAQSDIEAICLQAGQQYYLIIDSWHYDQPGDLGDSYRIDYMQVEPECFEDSECDDGDLCTGIEECVLGCCVQGPPFCPPWAFCDPALQECINVQDPCTAALNGFNSLYTGTNAEGQWKCDDIETWDGAGDKLLAYELFFQARDYWPEQVAAEVGTPIPVETVMFTVRPDGSCMPDQMIPGTHCDLTGYLTTTGDPPQSMMCEVEPQTVVLPNNSGDFDRCEIDFFVCLRSPAPWVAGPQIAGTGTEVVGGPAGFGDWSINVIMYEDVANGTDSFCSAGLDDCTNCTVDNVPDDALCDTVADPPSGDGVCDYVRPAGVMTDCFYASWFGGGETIADWADLWVCAEPAGACCQADGGCTDNVAPKDCVPPDIHQGTNVLDDFTVCADGDLDNDGYFFDCDNCPDDYTTDPPTPGVQNPQQRDCDGDGEGDKCEDAWADQDDDNDGCCNGVDECPTDPAKCDEGQCGCFEDEIDSDGDCTDGPAECVGNCMDCVDECPNSDIKCFIGICGCDALDEGDSDDDGVLDCVDECPGVDDAIFAPGCQGAIPTVSEWGLVILALLLLVAGKVYFGRRATA